MFGQEPKTDLATLITEIPRAEDFARAAVSTLNLAWRMAIDAEQAYQEELSIASYEFGDADESVDLTVADQEAIRRRHFERSQVSLGNALSLVQQAAELALKGRIASVSPFLLIVRDPRDLPRESGKRDVAFSEFRSIDAVDLVRVHDTVMAGQERLPHAFAPIWEDLRRRRNSLMHSVSPRRSEITPKAVLALVLWVNHFLLPSSPWPRRRLAEFVDADVEDVRPFRSGLRDYEFPISWTMHEMAVAIEIIPGDALKGALGYDPEDRHYHCPWCTATADSEVFVNLEGGMPKLATVTGDEDLRVTCLVCEAAYPVERRTCQLEGCGGDISSIYQGTEGTCLTCGWDTQDLELRRNRAMEQRLRGEASRDLEPYK